MLMSLMDELSINETVLQFSILLSYAQMLLKTSGLTYLAGQEVDTFCIHPYFVNTLEKDAY